MARTEWGAAMPRYRAHWEQRYGQRGGRWEEYEPGYRYAWEMRSDPRYRDRAWSEAEPELRQDWEARYRDKPWDRAADVIRDAWETVQLREEELIPHKETVQTGEVGIRKEVVAEQKTMDVPVTREEVVIEQHPVERHPSDRPVGVDERIEVPVREERVTVEKEPVVREEISVGKRQVEETKRVSDTVRREEARVETTGDVEVRDEGKRRGKK
jgi:uncharacterized protein (TIGR02271 family)